MDLQVRTVGVHQHILDLEGNNLGPSRKNRLSLGGDPLALLIGLSLKSVVLLDPGNEGGSAVGLPEMFSSDVKSLGDHPMTDLFVDDDAETLGVDVEDSSGSSVIEEMGHSCVDGPVDHDVHVLSHVDLLQIVLHSDGAVSSERSRELVSSSCSVSSRFTHFLYKICFGFIWRHD